MTALTPEAVGAARIAELETALQELYDWSNKAANGFTWRFADQPVAKKVQTLLSRDPAP